MFRLLILSAALLLSGCATTEPIGTQIGDSDSQNGRPIEYRVGALIATQQQSANGIVQILSFSTGVSRVSIQLNIEPSTSGDDYVAWLAGDSAQPEFITVLDQPFADVRHMGSFESSESLDRYSQVIISREKNNQQPDEPTEVVAQATLTTQPLNSNR